MGSKGGKKARKYTDMRAELLQQEIDRRHNERQREIDQRLIDMERAIDKAETSVNKRLEGMNEFREAMRDQQSRMMTRAEYDLAVKGAQAATDAITASLAGRIDKMEASADQMRGMAEGNSQRRLQWNQVIAFVAAVAAIASVLVLALKK